LEYICGWELSNPDIALFDWGVLELGRTCTKRDFDYEGFVPYETVRCLIPRNAELFELGYEQTQCGDRLTYYALVNEAGVRYIELSEPVHLWARARWIEEEEVPNWALCEDSLERSSFRPPDAGTGVCRSLSV
jgi:hypothetical protein